LRILLAPEQEISPSPRAADHHRAAAPASVRVTHQVATAEQHGANRLRTQSSSLLDSGVDSRTEVSL
jgi:hypothetical protein